jgi:asparagine synthase (glutamine-hydrolysing)
MHHRKCSNRSVPAPVVLSGEVYDRAATLSSDRLIDSSVQWLVDGFRLKGHRFLAELDGSFSVAYWQEFEGRLVLMTDRCGDGKLFVKKDCGGLKFSSWLRLLCDSREEIDRQAIQEFLRFLYVTAPRTMFRGIEQLVPGDLFIVSNGTVLVEALQSATFQTRSGTLADGAEAPLQEFQSLFEESIRRRIGARHVGVLLSSGVDSATLMAGCDQVNPGQVEAFTVGFDSVAMDESNAARAMANCLNVPHTTLRFGWAEYRAAFDKIAREFDQPFGDPSCLPLACAVGVARERVQIVCDGSGSDGIFGAPIPRHLRFALEFSNHLPPLMRRALATLVKSMSFLSLSSYGALFDFDDPEELFISWSGWKKHEMEDLLGEPIGLDETGFYRAFRSAKNTDAQQRYDAVSKFPPDDGRFEAAALEDMPMALPFHDAAVIDCVRRQPQSRRFEDGVTKVMLRRLFARYYADYNDILSKRYFNFPLQSFIEGDDFALVRRLLSNESLTRHGLFDPARVSPWMDRYLAGDQSLQFKIWSLLVVQSWLEARSEDE